MLTKARRSGSLAEPRDLTRIRRAIRRNGEAFSVGADQFVCADLRTARNVLGLTPDVFEERALLGPRSSTTRASRAVVRAQARSEQGALDQHELLGSLHGSASAEEGILRGTLNQFAPTVFGSAADGFLAASHNFIVSTLRLGQRPAEVDARKHTARQFYALIERALPRLQAEPCLASHLIDVGGRELSEADLAEQIAKTLMGFVASPAYAAMWALWERRPDGLIGTRVISDSELEQTAKELLRLRPPAWLHTRTLTESTKLAGEVLPSGTNVLVPVGYIQTSHAHWTDPFHFDPHRWDGAAADPPAYLTFGHGRRSCVGPGLGLEVVQSALQVPIKSVVKLAKGRRTWRAGPLFGPPAFTVKLAHATAA